MVFKIKIFSVVVFELNKATIQPGVSDNKDTVDDKAPVGQLAPVDSILDLIRNLIPGNIVYATFAQVQTWRTVTAKVYDCSNEVGASISNYTQCFQMEKFYDLRTGKWTTTSVVVLF